MKISKPAFEIMWPLEAEYKKVLRFKMFMQALLSTSNAILSTCQRTFPAFCRAASLSPHTLLSASLCPTFFPNCFFLFLFCIQPRWGGHCSWVLASFQDTKTVVWPHLWSRLLHSQSKVDFCTKNGTSKIIFWLDLSSNSFKNWIYQNMVVPIQVALLI